MSPPTRRSPYLVTSIVLASLVSIVGVGCSDFEEAWNEGQDTPASQPESPPVVGEFLEEPNGEVAAGNGIHNGAAENIGPITTQPNVLPVHLSAGAALPQSLPNGTAMSFSVDYQFRDGSPNQSNKYFWVIEGNGGKSWPFAIQLANRGTLPLIAPSLRPEAGPFSSHILEITPDGSQRRISKSISMR
ncbi:MAG: hypothetical protein HON53_15195 [Planctomycetaceae bacterium]|jgi:hypothetical protein|nr:hypothetical protein [Planctomycetaceae bacterium]MBT6154387.1 hypothetical protein [Planctomycetaceae bacterium]MBT6484082.1 hypothetical protein [Planctomycetaceae bacterium]MBT6496393.1 hypothetical protein [Planctomycetaceae bacterium]